MLPGLSWIVALPLLGFLMLTFAGRRLGKTAVGLVGVGSVGLSALLSIIYAILFFSNPPASGVIIDRLWTWISVGGLDVSISLRLDALSLVFILVITFVGFLIHLYSSEFMEDDEAYPRFLSYMNLFVTAMLILVLADNLLLLYLGWEGVGLCSYLLIGFWYKDPVNGYAARKAFVVTRVGDTAMAIGLFILFYAFGTFHIETILKNAPDVWSVGAPMAIAAAALLLGGAVGKSAQLPLQTWLPDAMAGPTPVSALIHAATMVTAGVYLIARTHVLFELAPVIQGLVAVVGLATLLIAGFSALVQYDIKRVLAYSTISQIGYMFLALGVGAWSAAVFHFMTHAFFKALLFLGAGVIIHTLHHEHNMFRMGGLKKQLPVTYWMFLIASGALAAVPLVTAGFYSKDAIIWYAWASQSGSAWLWGGAVIGAFITALYTFRMVFITFFGRATAQITHKPGLRLQLPLVVLGVLSFAGGFVELPATMGHFTPFSDFITAVLPATAAHHYDFFSELMFQLLVVALTATAIVIAWRLYLVKPAEQGEPSALQRFWYSGWGFDWLYDRLFVWPYTWMATINKNDFIDTFFNGLARVTAGLSRVLRVTQTGRLRNYAMSIAFGALITLTLMILL